MFVYSLSTKAEGPLLWSPSLDVTHAAEGGPFCSLPLARGGCVSVREGGRVQTSKDSQLEQVLAVHIN